MHRLINPIRSCNNDLQHQNQQQQYLNSNNNITKRMLYDSSLHNNIAAGEVQYTIQDEDDVEERLTHNFGDSGLVKSMRDQMTSPDDKKVNSTVLLPQQMIGANLEKN